MATPEALIVFKAIAARPKDLEDAEALAQGFEAVLAKARVLPRRSTRKRPKKPRR
jgi:hypothetical protein